MTSAIVGEWCLKKCQLLSEEVALWATQVLMLVCKHVAFLACWHTGLHNYNWTCCRIINFYTRALCGSWMTWMTESDASWQQSTGWCDANVGCPRSPHGQKVETQWITVLCQPCEVLGTPKSLEVKPCARAMAMSMLCGVRSCAQRIGKSRDVQHWLLRSSGIVLSQTCGSLPCYR